MAIALHGRVVAGEQLGCEHALELVPRLDADQPLDGSVLLFLGLLGIGILQPQRIYGLVGDDVVPVIGH